MEVEDPGKKLKGKSWKWKWRIPEGRYHPLPEKKINKAEQRGTGSDEESKGGGSTSKAARKTTVQRDSGESLCS